MGMKWLPVGVDPGRGTVWSWICVLLFERSALASKPSVLVSGRVVVLFWSCSGLIVWVWSCLVVRSEFDLVVWSDVCLTV